MPHRIGLSLLSGGSCTALLLLIAFLSQPVLAQQGDEDEGPPYYDKVVRLKDGTVIRNVEVTWEQEEGEYERYVIKSRNGEIVRKLPSEILVIETHSRTFLPPGYNPVGIVTPCDDRQREKLPYFLELRAFGYLTGEDESDSQIGINSFVFGPEVAGGFRFGAFGIGLGAAWFSSRDINRFPFFIHARYQLAMTCFAPFLFAQAGTVFDDQSGETLGFDNLLEAAPKLFSIGAGIDYPLSPSLDISFDLGYRYMQLPTAVLCDCSDIPERAEAIYYNESHGLLLRLGVTF
ncbi:outer membrane protein assembly factor [bacterium]|nr:outer membrane protein assembly factor [bacterium]